MENWLFDKRFLTNIAIDPETEETLTDEMIVDIQTKHQSKKCHELLHRIFLSQLELEINSSFDPQGDESVIGLQRQCAQTYIPNYIPPKGNIDPLIQIFQTNASGKRSVEYRYIWSEVMSEDLYTAFEEVEEFGGEDMKELGKKFRKCFLEKGGSVSSKDSFRSFSGRDVDNASFMRRYGLI